MYIILRIWLPGTLKYKEMKTFVLSTISGQTVGRNFLFRVGTTECFPNSVIPIIYLRVITNQIDLLYFFVFKIDNCNYQFIIIIKNSITRIPCYQGSDY